MNQKGFIPIIFIIIGAVVVASATFGVVKYKDEITANVSKVFNKPPKLEVVAPDIDSTGRDEAQKETELIKEPVIEEAERDDTQQLQEQLRKAEQKRLEAERQQVDKTKLDNYVVEYKDGRAWTWSDLDGFAIFVKNEMLDDNKRGLVRLEKNQEGLKELIISMKKYSDDAQMQTLINYMEVEEKANEKLIGALVNLIQAQQGLIGAIENRKEELYFYYSKRWNEFNSEVQTLKIDFLNKQKRRQDYAESISSQ